MTDFEDQLRRDLRIIWEHAQQAPIRSLRVPPAKRRSRAVRWLAPVTAMAAVVGIIAGVSLAGRPTGNRPASSRAPAGMPRHYVTLNDVMRGHTPVLMATVRDSATGATLASVQLLRGRPGESTNWPVGVWITAGASDRLFVIHDPAGLYALRLARDGRPERLSRFPASISDRVGPYPGVLSPDGTELALSSFSMSCPSARASCTSGVAVVSLTTGAIRTWLMHVTYPIQTTPLNWADGGIFVQFPAPPNFSCTRSDCYRLLNVAGRGGGLLADSRPIASPAAHRGWSLFPGLGLLTRNGQAVIASETRNDIRVVAGRAEVTKATCRILELSPVTGRLLKVLHVATARVSPGASPPQCYAEALAPTGLNALVQCVGLGRLDGRHFTPLPGDPYTGRIIPDVTEYGLAAW